MGAWVVWPIEMDPQRKILDPPLVSVILSEM